MRVLATVLFFVLLSCHGVAHAARTVNAEGVIAVKLELGQVTAVVFPEEVSTVTTPIAKASMDVSKDNVYVGFVPINPELPPNRNVVVGMSGRVYLVQVELAPEGKRGDDIVYVTHKAPSQGEPLTPVSVVRLLRFPDPKEPRQPVALTLPLPALSDTRVTLANPRQYTIGPYQALVVTLQNNQDMPLHIDERVGRVSPETPQVVALQAWIWPPGRRLVADAVDQEVLPAHGSITVYAVFVEKEGR